MKNYNPSWDLVDYTYVENNLWCIFYNDVDERATEYFEYNKHTDLEANNYYGFGSIDEFIENIYSALIVYYNTKTKEISFCQYWLNEDEDIAKEIDIDFIKPEDWINNINELIKNGLIKEE